MQQTIEACITCMEACNHCFTKCLEESAHHDLSGCIRLDRECADICALAAKAMQTDSPFLKEICALCADICEACGTECEKHDPIIAKRVRRLVLPAPITAAKWLRNEA